MTMCVVVDFSGIYLVCINVIVLCPRSVSLLHAPEYQLVLLIFCSWDLVYSLLLAVIRLCLCINTKSFISQSLMQFNVVRSTAVVLMWHTLSEPFRPACEMCIVWRCHVTVIWDRQGFTMFSSYSDLLFAQQIKQHVMACLLWLWLGL